MSLTVSIRTRQKRGAHGALRLWPIPCIAVVALLLPASAWGQPQAKQKAHSGPVKKNVTRPDAEEAPKLVVAVYPVEDLLLVQQDYPYRGGIPGASMRGTALLGGGSGGTGGGAGGGMGGMGGGGGGGMGGGMFSIPSTNVSPQVLRQFGGGGGGGPVQQRSDRSDEFMQVIDSYVKADWDIPGAAKSIFRNNLIVRNTVEVQDQVANLLSALRSKSAGARGVTIEATWLVLNPQQIETLRQALVGNRADAARKGFDELSRQATAIHGRLTCLNGQQVHLATGRRQVVSLGGTPTVGVGAAGYTPTISVVNLGAVLQVTPTLSGETDAFVDLQSVVTQWKEPAPPVQILSHVMAGSTEKKLDGPLVQTTITVDRADIGTQEWATTISIPVGQPTYVGSVTLSGEKAGRLEAGQNPELALVIEVHPN
jgi:hypothetical protein